MACVSPANARSRIDAVTAPDRRGKVVDGHRLLGEAGYERKLSPLPVVMTGRAIARALRARIVAACPQPIRAVRDAPDAPVQRVVRNWK
jgi:hypothetical protein